MSYRADASRWELNTPQGVQAAVLDYKREYDERVREHTHIDPTVYSCINAMVTYTAPGVSDRDKQSALTEIRNLELLHPGRMERLLNAFKILCTPPFSPRANHGGEHNDDAYEQIGPDPLAEAGLYNAPDPDETILPAAAAAAPVVALTNVGFFRPQNFNPELFRAEISRNPEIFRTQIAGYHAEYVVQQAALLANPITTTEEQKNVDNIIKALDFLIKLSGENYNPTQGDCNKLDKMLGAMKERGAGRLEIFAQECKKLFLDNEPKTEPKRELPK